jgi:N-acetylneuraminic acid mutarotase
MKSAGKLAIVSLSVLVSVSACQRNSSDDTTPASYLKWAWVAGSNTVNGTGSYGTLGTADPSNVPGAREDALSWLDPSGNFWLFGGYAYDSVGYMGLINDLWKFDPTTLEWTWVSGSHVRGQAGIYGNKGVAAPSNVPGARKGAVSWFDADGNLWLFGGLGYYEPDNFGSLNDLWKFDSTTLEWTWVSGSDTADQAGTYGTQGQAGPLNVPGARTGAVSWLDPGGNFWLFGGYGYDSSGTKDWLNDLWEYDPATLEWTWVSGSDTGAQAGTYGTKGTADPLNVPGGRYRALSWIDPQGILWLFGGDGLDSGGSRKDLNDLWKFDPTVPEWTWVSGGQIGGPAGNYGTLGTAGSSNVPGGRYAAISWLDASGKLWLFGGYGVDSGGTGGWLNDLWKYDPATVEWTWVSGSNTAGQMGYYGTLGTAESSNVPGARYFALSWIDHQGKLCLFGGYGRDSAGTGGWLNDLWRSTQ